MSNQLLNSAWKITGLTVAQKIVLIRLADRADKVGKCFPGHASLALDCGLTERSVRAALPALQSKGHLTIKREARKAFKGDSVFTYTVHPTPEIASAVTPENSAADTGNRPSRHRKFTTATPENGASPNNRTLRNQFNPQENRKIAGRFVHQSVDPKSL